MAKYNERFLELVKGILRKEGGYIDHPLDKGGATRFGITQRVARRAGYIGDMKKFPREKAIQIYHQQYWANKRLPLDKIYKWSPELAEELFDTAVNMGVVQAAKFLQQALNDIKDRFPLKVDGWAGAGTVSVMRSLRRDIHKRVMVKLCNHLQIAKYRAIVKRNPKQKVFLLGWVDKRG